MTRILFIGMGITSAVAASLLRQEFKRRLEIVAWEKARGVGGRMSTTRHPEIETSSVDLGAQYLSCFGEFRVTHKKFYEDLIGNNVLQTLPCDIDGIHHFDTPVNHYIAPMGLSSMVRYYLNHSEAELNFSHNVTSVWEEGKQLNVIASNGKKEKFDAVVITMPVPQILQLGGTIQEQIGDELKRNLRAVKYSSRYTLALLYKKAEMLNVPWVAKYVSDDPVIRYISIDSHMRGRAIDPTTVIFHSTKQFGKDYLKKTASEMEPILMQHITYMFKEWPKPSYVKCHKWNYSQVTHAFTGQPGSVTISTSPLLVLAGDGFTHSHFDGCIASANSVVEQIKTYLNI